MFLVFSDLKIPAQILLSENIYEEIRTPPLNSPGGSSSDSSTTFSGSSTETDSAKSTNTTQRNLKNAGKKLRNAPRQSRKSAGSLDSGSTGKSNLKLVNYNDKILVNSLHFHTNFFF